MGVVGRYQSADYGLYPRNARVICRTRRGLEVGIVLCPLDEDETVLRSGDGQLLRPIGGEDELILHRLEKFRDKAFIACKQLIADRKLSTVLVDVEHLFDGESVFFYFLGDVDEELEALTKELGETYEQKVRFKKFAETLASGCGPECGTDQAKCASGGCSSCGLSGTCGTQSVASAENT